MTATVARDLGGPQASAIASMATSTPGMSAPKRTIARAVTNDLIARPCRIAGIAQGKPLSLEAAAPCFHQQAGHSEATARLIGAQSGPVPALNGDGGRQVQTTGSLVAVIVR